MSSKHVLFKIEEIDRETLPYYFDYGKVVSTILEKLVEETNTEFYMYSDEDTSNEIWDILEEDLKEASPEVRLISHIYHEAETKTISSNHTDRVMEFIVKPRVENSLYYYPYYQVALAKVQVFTSDGERSYDLIFAKNDSSLVTFLQYVLKRKRDYIKNYVTVFTDTDDGVETEIESITSMVKREDVFLEDSLKKEIYRSIDEFFMDGGEFFKTYNIPYKRGILLYGKPGNGKTTLVKSIASSIHAPVAYWQITEYTSSYSIKEVFSSVLKLSPMVLVIEDIDSMPADVRSVFLNTLDGATSKEGVFLIGTTNYPEKIDPAMMNRSGRFDRAYEIKLPTKELRFQYLMNKKIEQILSEEEITEVVEVTKDFSYAQLNELYTSIALEWHYEKEVNVTRLCAELKSLHQKQKEQSWDDSSGGIGFVGYMEE
ncbi:ATP-binding protein [Ferdinandcohnia quinoae]|uniref:ATP-binding protein n=1 Tax=Fredinandcohnia quinoae TaxID=2918902 RepID=A0AAW5E761_9BACI|nr:ATP-binding protein [Fredinandcohnia sp. SECRCQ15]MCH1624624.1 ATP-binding protein [Fredinandcohnia sp. SECRCQ15]